MQFEETIPYFYADHALNAFWVKWSDGVLNVQQNIGKNFQEVIGSTNANDRTRAKEFYELGMIRGPLVTPQQLGREKPLGWIMLENNKHVHTPLGYLAYLLSKNEHYKSDEKIARSFSALCAFFSIQIGFCCKDGIQLSYGGLIEYLKKFFPKPTDVEEAIWLRYLSAGMFNTIHDASGEHLVNCILESLPIENLLFEWQDGKRIDANYDVFCKLIKDKQSLSSLKKPKHSLFFIGAETDERGIYSQAIKYCRDFVMFYAIQEIVEIQQGLKGNVCFNYNFLRKNPRYETPNVIYELLKLSNLSNDWRRIITDFMKTLQDGCIEATSLLYGLEAVNYIQPVSKTTKGYLPDFPYNRILFGPPGTGKSSKIKTEYANPEKYDIKSHRVTFHPDYEYGSFVGSYKPVSVLVGDKKEIQYEYIPQEFIKAYINAWNDPDHAHFLIIEEINRGNCAQIFGDLFQSLDRDTNGFSEYPVDTDADLAQYLLDFFEKNPTAADRLGEQLAYHKCPANAYNKIILPNNLYIYATMNTSDQSLFPMDSAFKRRWDWEYVPINYQPKDKSGNTIEVWIEIDAGEKYSWATFIEKVNKRIYEANQSEDKQLGFWFVKPSQQSGQFVISKDDFKAKVLFYLWFEVFRNEMNKSIFPVTIPDTNEPFGYGHLFDPTLEMTLLNKIMENLGITATS